MTALTPPTSSQLSASIANNTVLITGGASGIGLATAKLFAAAHANVVIADVGGEARLSAAAAAIGNGCTYHECDVSSWSAQVQLFNIVVERFGGIDIAFLNAAVHLEMKTEQGGAEAEAAKGLVACDFLAEEVEDGQGGGGKLKPPSLKVFEVNLFGVMYGMKLAVHHMRKQREGGRIIVTASANAYFSIPSSGQYDATKQGVLGLARSTAQRDDLKERGISVSVLCPSMTVTPMTAIVAKEKLAGIKSSEPGDVAWAVAWLAANEKKDVNGKTAMVKGKDLLEVEDSYRGWVLPLFWG